MKAAARRAVGGGRRRLRNLTFFRHLLSVLDNKFGKPRPTH
jgi:hypothetical protein